MHRLLTLALLGFLMGTPARAQMLQSIVEGTNTSAPPTSVQVMTMTPAALSGSGNRFFPMGYSGAPAGSSLTSMVMPVAGSFRNIRARAVTAPTGVQTFVISVEKNGTPTSTSCTIDATHNPCFVSTSTSFSAGDIVDVKSAPTGSPTSSIVSVAVDFVPTTLNDTILMGSPASAFSNVSAQALPPFANISPNSVSFRRIAILPTGGTIDKLFVASNAPGAGTSYTYSVDVNGAASGTPSTFSAIISNSGTSASDTTNSASVSDGNDVEFLATPSGTPSAATAGFGLRLVPTSGGDFVFIANGQGNNASGTATTYYSLTGTRDTTTEANVQSLVNNMTLTKLRASVAVAPGVGKSFAFTLNKNGSGTALTCTVQDLNTSCTQTTSVAAADNDLLSLVVVPSGTPSAQSPSISLLAHR